MRSAVPTTRKHEHMTNVMMTKKTSQHNEVLEYSLKEPTPSLPRRQKIGEESPEKDFKSSFLSRLRKDTFEEARCYTRISERQNDKSYGTKLQVVQD